MLSPKSNILRRLYDEKSIMKNRMLNSKDQVERKNCIIEMRLENLILNPTGMFAVVRLFELIF